MSITHQPVAQDNYEVALNVTIAEKSEQKTAYTVNIKQDCVLKMSTRDGKQRKEIFIIANLVFKRQSYLELLNCSLKLKKGNVHV